jgi:hypothetical protein
MRKALGILFGIVGLAISGPETGATVALSIPVSPNPSEVLEGATARYKADIHFVATANERLQIKDPLTFSFVYVSGDKTDKPIDLLPDTFENCVGNFSGSPNLNSPPTCSFNFAVTTSRPPLPDDEEGGVWNVLLTIPIQVTLQNGSPDPDFPRTSTTISAGLVIDDVPEPKSVLLLLTACLALVYVRMLASRSSHKTGQLHQCIWRRSRLS